MLYTLYDSVAKPQRKNFWTSQLQQLLFNVGWHFGDAQSKRNNQWSPGIVINVSSYV